MERRGLTGSIAAVRGKESRLEEIPATEQWLHIEALKEQASRDGLPDKLSLLRQKLSQKGQAGAEVPVLCVVRPDLPARCAGGGMGTGASQSGRAWGGRREDRTDRSVGGRREGIPGRYSGVAARQDIYAESGTARLHTESEWQIAAVGHPDGVEPGGPDGGPADPGTDLRSRFRGLFLRVPSGALGTPGVGGDTRACESRVSSGV